MMKIIVWETMNKAEQARLLKRNNSLIEETVVNDVRNIIDKVRCDGDAALRYYTERFDKIKLGAIALKPEAWQRANKVDTSIKEAIKQAYENIKCFHELQLPGPIKLTQNGINAWLEYRCIERIGLYVPGGTAPLVSTLLMLAIPASLAGCKEIIVATPPDKNACIDPAMIYAAKLCGITQLYTVGGAQAIAALAYGTETVPNVMKIFGPGNNYVTQAKLQVAQDPNGAALDMPAGPSEVLVIADATANPDLVAADLLAQAEHDANAQAVLVTTQQALANAVKNAIQTQLKSLSRQAIILQSLQNALIIIVNDINDAFALSNAYAPEHLILQIENPHSRLNQIQNAGSVFIGPLSAEAFGDYGTGPNHVLPTGGYAKSYSGLSVKSFMKSMTFQEVTQQGVKRLAKTIETLADLEGLDAHKASVAIRRKIMEKNR